MFYLYSIWRAFYRRRHRRSVRFIKNLPIKNAPAPPWGTRTENTFLRYHLVCRKIRPLCNGANTPSALNAGNTSADTRVSPFPLPSAAHLLLRFSLRSQLPELSVDALRSFTSASLVWILLPYLTTVLSVCQELFSAGGGNGCQPLICMLE